MDDLRALALNAVHAARLALSWRPGKAIVHPAKRINLGHLKPGTTLDEYQIIITQVLHDPQAKVYVFSFHGIRYPAFVSEYNRTIWLVMLDAEGRMETAFVVEKPETYLADPRFAFLGKYQELVS
jgi:hypothetical protein